MDKLEIRYYGDPVLNQKCEPITEINKDVQDLIDGMLEVMYLEDGVGLAAPQVGINRRIIIIDPSRGQFQKDLLIMINPEITEMSREIISLKEGCLSFPGIEANIERPKSIKVRFIDNHGQERLLEATDYLSRIIQHEMDHLDGILFVERMSSVERNLLIKRIRKLKKETQLKLTRYSASSR